MGTIGLEVAMEGKGLVGWSIIMNCDNGKQMNLAGTVGQ